MPEETPQERVQKALDSPPRAAAPVQVRHVQISAGDLVDLLKALPEQDEDTAVILKGNEGLPRDRPVIITAEFARRLSGGGATSSSPPTAEAQAQPPRQQRKAAPQPGEG